MYTKIDSKTATANSEQGDIIVSEACPFAASESMLHTLGDRAIAEARREEQHVARRYLQNSYSLRSAYFKRTA